MNDPYNYLESKVQEFVRDNQQYQEKADILKLQSCKMTLNEILEFDASGSPYMMSLKYLLCFKLYLDEAPKGVLYCKMSNYYADALEKMQEDCKSVVIPFISTLYSDALSKELVASSLSDLEEWLDVYSYLESKGILMDSFKDSFYLKLSNIVLSSLEGEQRIDHYLKITKIAIQFKNLKNDFENFSSLLVDSIYSNLTSTHVFNKKVEKPDLSLIRALIEDMKSLKLQNLQAKIKIKFLEEFFASKDNLLQANINVYSPKQIPKKKIEKEFRWNINLSHKMIDFSKIDTSEIIYQCDSDPMFNVFIQNCLTCEYKGLALKIYDKKDPIYNMDRIQNEINILETLSLYSDENETFLNFYGSYRNESEVFIAIEYYKTSLKDIISFASSINFPFQEEFLHYHAKEFILAFAKMENFGIYHLNLNPCNILVTDDDWQLKITNFSIFESKSYDEIEMPIEDKYYNDSFKAPELFYKNFKVNGEQMNYRRSKADVFSLGLVLLYMYDFMEIGDLNLNENHPILMRRVNEVEYPWLKTLLWSMLQLENSKRPPFEKLRNLLS